MNDKRNVNIDIYKGIACWFLVWGHTIQYCYAGEGDFYENIVFRFIYGFHMPFFMMISGYLFYTSCRKYNLHIVIKKRMYHIAYPLVIWNGIDFVFKLFCQLGRIHTFYDFLRLFYKSLMGLWFLWSILIISVSVAVIYFNVLTPRRRMAGYIIVFVILILIPGLLEPCKTMNIWMYPYFLAGFLLSEKRIVSNNLRLSRVRKIKYAFIVLYPALLHFFHFRDYIYISGIKLFGSDYGFAKQFQINIYRWILGYAGIIFVVVILDILFQWQCLKSILTLLFGNLGKVTLQVYVIQRILLEQIFGGIYKIAILYGGGVNILIYNICLYNIVLTPIIGLIHLFEIYWFILWLKKHGKLNKYLFDLANGDN